MSIVRSTAEFIRAQIRSIARKLNALSNGRVTPNQVTAAGFLMHIPIAVLIALNHLGWAAVFLIVFGLFDTLDGELARLQHREGPKGALYDAASDRLKEALVYAGIAYWLATVGEAKWVFVPVLACGLSTTVSYVKAKGEAALALEKQFKSHYALNRHFSDGFATFEIRITIIVLGLVTHQVLLATTLVAILAAVTVLGRIKAIIAQL